LGMAFGEMEATVAGSDLARLRCPWCVTMGRLAFDIRHIYTPPLDVVVGRFYLASLRRRFGGLLGEVMHDPATGLRRKTVPRTRVNRDMKKGRGIEALALLLRVACSLRRAALLYGSYLSRQRAGDYSDIVRLMSTADGCALGSRLGPLDGTACAETNSVGATMSTHTAIASAKNI
jgi:hypothetical protein